MSIINPAFALSVVPRYIYLTEVPEELAPRFQWWRIGKRIHVQVGEPSVEFVNEADAWRYASAKVPDLIVRLKRAAMPNCAYALRAEMMLALGSAGFDAAVEEMHQEVVGIFEQAMRSLDAVQRSKAKPKVVRVAQSKSVSWLEVRVRAQLPYLPEPVQVAVRCLPSPVEQKTWSVRLRIACETDQSILETQYRFDDLVTNLGYQGITVKDVLNGTCYDI